MKKFLRYILPVVAFAMIMASCEKEEKTWDGVQVGFERSAGDLMIPTDVTTTQEGVFRVALIASPQASDISLTFEIDPSSTAVEGTHFSLPSTSVTIPAGQNFAEFQINALDEGFTYGGEFKTLVLTLVDASAEVAANFSKMSINISKESFIDSFSGTFSAFEFEKPDLDNPVYGPYSVENSVVPGTNNISLMGIWDWATDPVILQFDNTDNSITVELQQFNTNGLQCEGTGTFDMETQTFELDLTIVYGGAPYAYTYIKYSRSAKGMQIESKKKSDMKLL